MSFVSSARAARSSVTRTVVPAQRRTRLEAFSDGVFAIAITLLVLGIKVPPSGGAEALAHRERRPRTPVPELTKREAFMNAYLSLGICAALALYYTLPQAIESQLDPAG